MTARKPKFGEVWIVDLGYQLEMEIGHIGTLDGLASALGVPSLLQDDVQIVKLSTIADLGLPAFLTMGYEVTDSEMAPHLGAFKNLKGSIAVIRAGAFRGETVTIGPDSHARLIAVLTEPGSALPSLDQVASESAKGVLTPKTKAPKSDARIGGMVATCALLVMFALVGVMVWIAG